MSGFIDKVALLREELRELETERAKYASGDFKIESLEPGQRVTNVAVILQKIDREILKHRIEIIAMGGDPDT